MAKFDSTSNPAVNPSSSVEQLAVSDRQAFLKTQDSFKKLEADGITRFQMFNALADLFNREQLPELSSLMADAAYQCYQEDFD